MKVKSVAKARKSPGQCIKCGKKIPKGAAYRWTKGRFGPKKLFCDQAKCRPRQSDLTSSDKLSTLYAIQEGLEDLLATEPGQADLAEALRDAAASANDVAQEYRDSKDNMPENLQYSSTAEDMESKADEIESWAQELESAADDIESMDDWEATDDAEEDKPDEGETDAGDEDGEAAEPEDDTDSAEAKQHEAYSRAEEAVGSLSI